MTSLCDFDKQKKVWWFDVFGLVIMFDLSFCLTIYNISLDYVLLCEKNA
jgi:hypothetical protein